MKKRLPGLISIGVLASLSIPRADFGQSADFGSTRGSQPTANADIAQTAHIFGLDRLLQKLAALPAKNGCESTMSLEELSVRQEILESIELDTLNVDSVLAEIANEEGQLSDIRTTLQAERERSVARLNTAALLTGSGAGAAVSATQFTGLGSRINNVGDGIGIGAGVASTIFSILATRKQKGSRQSVGLIPNMLAPLLGGSPVLDTYYPPPVMQYLQTVPADESAERGTRLDQLKQGWAKSDRLSASSADGRAKEIAILTSSANPEVKASIQDLSNRIAMLIDVSGRVSLIKRDLAAIMRSYMRDSYRCPTP